MKFTELNLHPDLQKAIDEAGFTDCFPVQEQTFQRTLQGKDVTVQSQTGTGKTAAFLITIYQHLSMNPKFQGKKALIIVPTRELATQIENDAAVIGKYLPFKIASFFGGIGYGKQEAQLREGVDILIGTPGRLIDFSRQKKINLGDIGILVIDEADRLFDMGFLPDLRKLLRKMVDAEERLTMLLSATLSLRVSTLSWEYMNGPDEIQIDPEQVTVDKITQTLYHVSSSEKMPLLLGILKKYQPKNAIIFTNTKHAAEEISKRLELNDFKSQFLMGDLPQKKRLRIIDDMKAGNISFLVATDVAARGLHVEDLDMVVNYDVPEDAENYVHRIGRTARVGKTGKAFTMACERFVFGLEAIEKYIGMKIPVDTIEEGLLIPDKSAGMKIYTERWGRNDRREGREGRGDRREGRGRPGDRRHGRPEKPRFPRETPLEGVGSQPGSLGSPSSPGSPNSPGSPSAPGRPPKPHQDRPRPEGRKEGRPDRERFEGRPERRGPRKPKGVKLTQEERITLYKEKYGENFQAQEEKRRHGKRPQTERPKQPEARPEAAAAEKKPSLIKKILGFFTGKSS